MKIKGISDKGVRRIANNNRQNIAKSANAADDAYDIVATVSNPESDSYMSEFPGLDALGDAGHNVSSETIDALIYALHAGEFWGEAGFSG